MIFKSATLALIASLAAVCGHADSQVDFTQDGSLHAKFPGVEISAAMPSVKVGGGSVWVPDGSFERSTAPTLRETPLGLGTEETLTWKNPKGYTVTWTLCRLKDSQAFTLRMAFTNNSAGPVQLDHFLFCQAPEGGVLCDGKAEDWFLNTSSPLGRRGGYSLAAKVPSVAALIADQCSDVSPRFLEGRAPQQDKDPTWRRFADDALLYSEPDGKGVTIAAVGTESDTSINFKVDGCKLALEILGKMDVSVDPGETRESDEILFSFKPWREAAIDKCRWIAKTCGSRNTEPVFGWCSWYRMRLGVDEKRILAFCDFVKANRERVPFDVIQIDEGWQIGRHDWRPNEKFPSGMEAIAQRIAAAGAVPGIWMCPTNCTSRRFVDGKIVEFSLDDKKGELIRAFPGSWYQGGRNGDEGFLDPTHPQVQAFIRREIARMVQEGYHYFKMDFMHIVGPSYYDKKKTRFQVQRGLFKLYRECIGEKGYLLGCVALPRVAAGYADAVRVGTDTSCGPFAERPLGVDGNPKGVFGFWFPIRSLMAASLFNGRVITPDPDVSYVGKIERWDPGIKAVRIECPDSQLRTFHSIIGLLGGTAMVSDQLQLPDFQTPQLLRMVEILHPVSPEKGWPFAGPSDPMGKEFGFVAERPFGNFASVVLWNPQHEAPADLGLSHVPREKIGEKFHLWSFWDGKYLGVRDKNYQAKGVAPYECQLLRLSPVAKDGRPVLVGSDLHITMGATEVKNIASNAKGISIELNPDAGALEGKLYLFSAKPLRLKAAEGCKATVANPEPKLYVVSLEERKRGTNQAVTLETGK